MRRIGVLLLLLSSVAQAQQPQSGVERVQALLPCDVARRGQVRYLIPDGGFWACDTESSTAETPHWWRIEVRQSDMDALADAMATDADLAAMETMLATQVDVLDGSVAQVQAELAEHALAISAVQTSAGNAVADASEAHALAAIAGATASAAQSTATSASSAASAAQTTANGAATTASAAQATAAGAATAAAAAQATAAGHTTQIADLLARMTAAEAAVTAAQAFRQTRCGSATITGISIPLAGLSPATNVTVTGGLTSGKCFVIPAASLPALAVPQCAITSAGVVAVSFKAAGLLSLLAIPTGDYGACVVNP